MDRDRPGNATGVTATDDGEHRSALQDALLDTLVQQSQLGVGVCDDRGRLVMVSPALASALGAGYSPTDDAVWARHYCLHDEHGNLLSPGGDPLARAFRGERFTDEAVTVRRPGEPVRSILCSGFPLQSPTGDRVGAAVFVLDVTARTAERRRLDVLRERLVETVNHEVRTPLATLRGHLELVEPEVGGLPASVQWSLGAMQRATARLGEVVDTISELADESQSVP